MRTTIDKAGRLVIPKELRDRVGLRPGPVSVTVAGAALRVEPLHTDELTEKDGLLLLPDAGPALSDDDVRDLRLADQR